ncbi:MAG: CapA family protein, partial [Polyangiaceae bacterium]
MELPVIVPLVVAAAVAVCTFGDGRASPTAAPPAAPTASAAALAIWAPSDSAVEHRGGAHAGLRVLIAGDLLPHRPMLSEPSQIASALAPLHALFASADAVVANYETATGSVGAARDRALVYGVDPAWMDAVAGSGVTALTLANNHACDLGTAGLTATIDAARGNVVGLGADREDPWKARTVAEKNGRR